ncbi:MAG TPA: hypothetical protein VH353_09505 [Caulobacteraceae bacterium]|nr:hypothetical protein [Caulobacteraceae bacterium]
MLAGVATVAIIFGAAAIIAAGEARASTQADTIAAAGPHFSNNLAPPGRRA